MTRDPRTAVKVASRPSRQDGLARPDLLRRAAALLKDLFADPDADLPTNDRDKTRKSRDGVFQPPRY